MRSFVIVVAVTGALTLGLLVSRGSSAPALAEKPVRYEYAELKFTRKIVGVPKGAPPGTPQPPPQVTVLWSTSQDEIKQDAWQELADKLKAPAPKKEGSETLHRLRVFDRLGADGWKLMEHKEKQDFFATEVWTFKRRVP